MHNTLANEKLFSYGTLQLEAVQLATFGRRLEGRPDALIGFRLESVEIRDPDVVATSGLTHHPMLVPTGSISDTVPGTVFFITSEELTQADAYEVSAYRRDSAVTAAGLTVWIYADARRAP